MRRRAVILDRDGTINREQGIVRRLSQLRILPGVASAIRELNRAGFLVIVATNQPVVARGWLTEAQVRHFHEVMTDRLRRAGARVDAVYFCPHHPNANLKKYRMQCACRKPNPGLLKQAIRELGIDPKKSFMIGDHGWDVLAGKRAGFHTVLVKTSGRSDDPRYAYLKPEFTVKNLREAVRIIKRL